MATPLRPLRGSSAGACRRANDPILTQGGSDKKQQYRASMPCNRNE